MGSCRHPAPARDDPVSRWRLRRVQVSAVPSAAAAASSAGSRVVVARIYRRWRAKERANETCSPDVWRDRRCSSVARRAREPRARCAPGDRRDHQGLSGDASGRARRDRQRLYGQAPRGGRRNNGRGPQAPVVVGECEREQQPGARCCQSGRRSQRGDRRQCGSAVLLAASGHARQSAWRCHAGRVFRL